MSLRIGFSFSEKMDEELGCEVNMTKALKNIIEIYDYEEFPELFYKILLEVDKVTMKRYLIFRTEIGCIHSIEDLSNTCKTLLSLLLDYKGKFRFSSSFIGDGYHHLLDNISEVSDAILIVDYDLTLFNKKRKEGEFLSGCKCNTFRSFDYGNLYTRGTRDYIEQSINHFCLWQYHNDIDKLQYNNRGLVLKESLFNKWAGYHSIYWDEEEGEYYD